MGQVGLGSVWFGMVRFGAVRCGLVRSKMTRGSVYLTSLERQVESILKELDIEYIAQYPVHSGFVLDFAILNKKIAIEVDGKKWHSSKEAMKRDRFKDYQLKREGWKVIRIKEEEMNEKFLVQMFDRLGVVSGNT